MALIASGDAPQRIVDEIKRREVQSKDLQAELARLRDAQPTGSISTGFATWRLNGPRSALGALYGRPKRAAGAPATPGSTDHLQTRRAGILARRRNAVCGALCAGAFGNPHKAGVPTGIRTPVAAVKGPFKGYGRPLTPRSPPASTSIADGGTARQIDDAEAERIYEKTATQSSPARSWRAASAHRPASR